METKFPKSIIVLLLLLSCGQASSSEDVKGIFKQTQDCLLTTRTQLDQEQKNIARPVKQIESEYIGRCFRYFKELEEDSDKPESESPILDNFKTIFKPESEAEEKQRLISTTYGNFILEQKQILQKTREEAQNEIKKIKEENDKLKSELRSNLKSNEGNKIENHHQQMMIKRDKEIIQEHEQLIEELSLINKNLQSNTSNARVQINALKQEHKLVVKDLEDSKDREIQSLREAEQTLRKEKEEEMATLKASHEVEKTAALEILIESHKKEKKFLEEEKENKNKEHVEKLKKERMVNKENLEKVTKELKDTFIKDFEDKKKLIQEEKKELEILLKKQNEQVINDHKEKLASLEKEHADELHLLTEKNTNSLTEELRKLKEAKKLKTLNKLDSQAEVHSENLKKVKTEYSKILEEIQKEQEGVKHSHHNQLNDLKNEHDKQLKEITLHHEELLKQKNTQIETIKEQISKVQDTLKSTETQCKSKLGEKDQEYKKLSESFNDIKTKVIEIEKNQVEMVKFNKKELIESHGELLVEQEKLRKRTSMVEKLVGIIETNEKAEAERVKKDDFKLRHLRNDLNGSPSVAKP